MLGYDDYIDRYKEDTESAKELYLIEKKSIHNIKILKKYKRTDNNKGTIGKRLKTAQKELFLIRRHLLKIYSRTIGLHNLQENIVKEREKALKTKLIFHPKLFF